MYQLDVSSLSDFMASLWSLAGGALRFDENAYIAAVGQEGGTALTITLLFLAGLSITLGQSVVLFTNQVRRRRFVISIITFAALFVLGVVVWAATIWLLASLIFDAEETYRNTLIVVALSYTPYLFGFLVLLPYLGIVISVFLRAWVYLGILLSVSALYHFNLLQAFICTFLGWLLIELLSQFRPLRIESIQNWVWRVTTGTQRELQAQELVDHYVELSKQAIDEIRSRARSGRMKR